MKKAPENPLTKLADAAFRQGAQKVIERAIEAGTPVIAGKMALGKEVKPRNYERKGLTEAET